MAWLDRQAMQTLYLTSTSLAELLVGVDRLPEGRRKRGLAEGLEGLLHDLFGSRILPFDSKAAAAYAAVVRGAQEHGETVSVGDGQIAAIAQAHGFMVATRDTAPFVAAGLKVLDPWTA